MRFEELVAVSERLRATTGKKETAKSRDVGGHIYAFFLSTGTVKIKVDPFPGLLLAVIVPPCRSTIFLQMGSPIPVPEYSCLRWRR